MTPRTRRRALILAVVVVIAAVVVGGRLGDGGPAGSTSGRAAAGRQAPAAREPAPPTVADVRLEDLKSPRASLDATERDLFRFKAPPAPPPRPAAPPPPPRPVLPPMPQGPPPPPPIALKFIGLVEGAGQAARVAVLTDSRGSVFYGKEGDIIDGRYRVLKITPESAELAYVDGQGRQLLRLSGQ